MNRSQTAPEMSEALLEIGAKLFPRRRHSRFKDLKPDDQAAEWARSLNWRENPYDRFLLRREILHHAEVAAFRDIRRNFYIFASRAEIEAEVDRLMAKFPKKFESMGVFAYVLVSLPWTLGFKHGRIRYSKLAKALATLP